MSTTTFDTHAFVKRLKDAGFTEVQAEAVSTAHREALAESLETQISTKADFMRLEARIDLLDTKFTGEFTLVKWMLGILLGGVIALVLKSFFP